MPNHKETNRTIRHRMSEDVSSQLTLRLRHLLNSGFRQTANRFKF